MNPAPGAERPATPEPPGLSAAAGNFASSVSRYLQAFSGLLGLELRETGLQALILALLAVAAIVALVFAYLFLLLGATIALVGWLGGGWIAALLGLFVLHLALAAVLLLVLRAKARRPLFSGTREALRREVERIP
jgi:uncharacterized membrane protein YqjE